MSRRTAIVSALASAAIAAAVTAGAFLITRAGDPLLAPQPDGGILATDTAVIPDVRTPTAPEPEEPIAEEEVGSSDWAEIYAATVPSLVSIGVDNGAGSGFFVSKDGHVITNLHVVADSESIVVLTNEGTRLDAELIASDAGNDLALLKVDPDGLDILLPTFASMDQLRIGDPVGALGAPFGLPNTLTVGVISGLERLRPSGNATFEPLRNMIQTDAALNPGNSGGMLVDARGRVIGIPTQIESPDRVSSGIGFAVSADALLKALPTMLKGKNVERGYLGVSISSDSGELTIVDVVCDSAADEAGLLEGDVILQIDGQPAETFGELTDTLAALAPGDEFSIQVRRGLRELSIEATAGAWPTTIPQGGCG